MNAIDSIIARIKAEYEDYDASGLINEDLLYDDLITAIKSFGNDITIFKEEVIDLENGKAKLPEDFYAISTVMVVEPYRCNDSAIEYRTLTGLSFLTDIKLIRDRWNECEDCCNNIEEKYIRKEQYLANSVSIVDYKKGKFLKQGKTFDKSVCNKHIREAWKKDEKDEFIIVGKEIRTNILDKTLYLVYKGFSTDDSGNIDIPETPNGHLYDYLVNYGMSKVAIRLLRSTRGNAQFLAQDAQISEQRAKIAKHNAHTDLKMMQFNINRLSGKIVAGNIAEYKINGII